MLLFIIAVVVLRQLSELRAEYTKTKDELDGEIMVLTKKLDSLEEFRQQKEQLMNKFEKLETDSKQKMEDYEKRLYDLEKSHIREQDRLKVRFSLPTYYWLFMDQFGAKEVTISVCLSVQNKLECSCSIFRTQVKKNASDLSFNSEPDGV